MKINLGWLQLKAPPKTLTTNSSEVSTASQKSSKQSAAQFNTCFTYLSWDTMAEESKEMLCKQLTTQFWGEILIAQK